MSAAKLVIPQLDAILVPWGCRRHKQTWNRRAGGLVDVIDLQVSKAGDTMTANLGVLDLEVFSRLKVVVGYECVAR